MKPKRAVLTNLHNDLDYATLARQLPDHIRPATTAWCWRSEPAERIANRKRPHAEPVEARTKVVRPSTGSG